jgi:hypothetical protein
MEKAIKFAAFDCQDCGDCYLPENFGCCTMGGCEKGLSNAPCGDSTVDGRCGNNLDRICVGERIYDAAIAEREGYQPKTPTLTLHRGLRDSMKRGRIWEFSVAMMFYFKTSLLEGVRMMPVAWDLISRGLMPVFPPKRSKKGSQEVTAIMKAVTSMQKSGGVK